MNAGHIEAAVRVAREHADLVETLMNGQGAVAVTLTDPQDTPLWEPGVGETPLWGQVVVTGLFEASASTEALGAVLALAPGVESRDGVTVRNVPERQWERAWMDRFGPMQFGEQLWIVPTGQDAPNEDATVVRLDPGLAFGTGTHASTRLCLEWIDSVAFSGRTVLDFGCGSGVLGIAAALKGATRVVCVDHDPQAVVATRDNAARNGVADRIEVRQGDTPPEGAWDRVLANILAGILVSRADALQDAVAPGGRLALAGILDEQADTVTAAFDRRFPRLERCPHDGWTLLHGRLDP